jgi:hypothetical protein
MDDDDNRIFLEIAETVGQHFAKEQFGPVSSGVAFNV